jgi:hypothetical protein
LALLAAASALPSRADGPAGPPEPSRYELSVGGQSFHRAWALYSGLTMAPFGSIREDGWRLRTSGGYGAYDYASAQATTIDVAAPFANLLAGYQWQLGPVTLKAFAGVAMSDHRLTPWDPDARMRGPGVGAEVVLETWWTMSEQVWSSLDLSYGTLYSSYAARGRLGWRVLPALSLGIEAGATGNIDGDLARAGAFVRYEWATGEVSASGGLANDTLLDNAVPTSLAGNNRPYATLTWLTRF